MNPIVQMVYMLDDAAELLREFLHQLEPPGKGNDGPCMNKQELIQQATEWLAEYQTTQPPSSQRVG